MYEFRVYIDQSVVSMLQKQTIQLPKVPNLIWVYSYEHFEEFTRNGCDPTAYLDILLKIDAKLLTIELNVENQNTGFATLHLDETPQDLFKAYIDNLKNIQANINYLNPLSARINGNSDPNLWDKQKSALTTLFSEFNTANGFYPEDQQEILEGIEEIFSYEHNIEKLRESLGSKKGSFGAFQVDEALHKMWDIISDKIPRISMNSFFGFSNSKDDAASEAAMHSGIVGCCAILDLLGFNHEKKCRKLSDIPNIRSDAIHIANAYFCHALLSKDTKMVNRANAIYRFKDIGTNAIHLNEIINRVKTQNT